MTYVGVFEMRAIVYLDYIQSVAFDIWYIVAYSVRQDESFYHDSDPPKFVVKTVRILWMTQDFPTQKNIILISETARCQTGKWPCIFPQHTYQSSGEDAIFFISFQWFRIINMSCMTSCLRTIEYREISWHLDRDRRLLSSSWRSEYVIACSQKRSILLVVGLCVTRTMLTLHQGSISI